MSRRRFGRATIAWSVVGLAGAVPLCLWALSHRGSPVVAPGPPPAAPPATEQLVLVPDTPEPKSSLEPLVFLRLGEISLPVVAGTPLGVSVALENRSTGSIDYTRSSATFAAIQVLRGRLIRRAPRFASFPAAQGGPILGETLSAGGARTWTLFLGHLFEQIPEGPHEIEYVLELPFFDTAASPDRGVRAEGVAVAKGTLRFDVAAGDSQSRITAVEELFDTWMAPGDYWARHEAMSALSSTVHPDALPVLIRALPGHPVRTLSDTITRIPPTEAAQLDLEKLVRSSAKPGVACEATFVLAAWRRVVTEATIRAGLQAPSWEACTAALEYVRVMKRPEYYRIVETLKLAQSSRAYVAQLARSVLAERTRED